GREQVEQIRLLALAHRIALICLPGDAQPDPHLAALCTAPVPVADTVFRYCIEGGVANAVTMLRYLSDTLLGTRLGYDLPQPMPECGIYHPDCPTVLERGEWQRRVENLRRPTGAVVFYRAHWLTGN